MSESNLDYSDVVEEEPVKNEDLARMAVLIAEARAKEAEIDALGANLKSAQEALFSIICFQIPALMKELGLEEFKDRNGLKVEIDESIKAGISDDRKAAAHRWLEEHGHGGLIKREITVSFNKGQEEAAAKLMAELAPRFSAVTQKQSVHHSTLKAWATEQLEKGAPIPVDTFGIYRQKMAKFSDTGKKKGT